MGVLLLVACEVTCVSPHQVQQPEGNVGRTMARVELRAPRREQRGGGGQEETWLVLDCHIVTGRVIFYHLFSNFTDTLHHL